MNCSKLEYESLEDALKAMREISRRMKTGNKVQHVYMCPICNKWHLTRMTRAQSENYQKRNKRF